VRTDERRLRQILVNLLSNAVKYTSEGHIAVDIQYRNQVATFTIRDTGSGIPAEDLPVIFEPFERGSGEQSKLAPGLGLGLTITRLLTQTLGGEITVESKPGEGTSFRVRLMLYRLHRSATAADVKILTYTGPRRVIMVVDDNEEHRELMREALAPLDFVILTAASGPECLALMEGVRPDIYLVDISMPSMNGWELAAKLRAIGQTAPILMLSANIGDGAAGIPAGGDHNDLLAKPVDFRQLQDRLARWLGLEWLYAAAAAESGAKAEPEMKSPGASHLQELIRLGEIGYVRGIEAKLGDLAKQSENRRFTEVMAAHIKAFKIDAYLADLRRLEREEGLL
jgi:CheY-like chemotaxis protein/anti-sigma regulatory factor (Ser/Thr protein kinase)